MGTVMTGLLLGSCSPDGQRRGGRRIRLAGDVSGGGGRVALIGSVMWRVLPRFAVHSTLSYPQLMASMAHLWQRYPALRRAALRARSLSPLAPSGRRWR